MSVTANALPNRGTEDCAMSPTPAPFWVLGADGKVMHWTPAGEARRKPSIFMIGAAKTGTTATAAMLAQHPALSLGLVKEPHFFSADAMFERGIEWYEQLFSEAGEGERCIDASVSYSSALYGSRAAERIAAYAPDAKIILLLREPAKRAESEVVQTLKFMDNVFGANDLPRSADDLYHHLAERKLEYGVDIAGNSNYVAIFETWLRHFPREQLFVSSNELMRDDLHGVLEEMTGFLEVPPHQFSQVVSNTTSDYLHMIAQRSVRAQLASVPGAQVLRSAIPQPIRNLLVNAITRKQPGDALRFSDGLMDGLRADLRRANEGLEKFVDREILDAWGW